jgi:hypothetical protein
MSNPLSNITRCSFNDSRHVGRGCRGYNCPGCRCEQLAFGMLRQKMCNNNKGGCSHNVYFFTADKDLDQFLLLLLFLLLPWRIRLAHTHSVLKLFLKFELHRQSVGPLEGWSALSQGRYLHRTTQTQNKRRQIFLPRVGLQATIQIFKRAKTFHALDSAATVIGLL